MIRANENVLQAARMCVRNRVRFLPAGYTIYRQDRDGRGGGILLAVSDRIVSSRVHVSTTCELLVVSLVLHPATLVCCVYIPPSSPVSYYENLISSFQSLSKTTSSHLVLLGDFNVIDINWTSFHASSLPSLFCDLVNVIQLVSEPTHSHGNILDLVLSDPPDLISDLTVDPYTCKDISDHSLPSLFLPVYIKILHKSQSQIHFQLL